MAPLLLNDEMLRVCDLDIKLLADHNLLCDRTERYNNTSIHVSAERVDALTVARRVAKQKIAQGDNSVFYMMNMSGVVDVMESWRKNLPSIQPFYLLRCNQDSVLLSLLLKDGNVGLSCSDRKELDIALQHVNKEQILYSNPFWTRANIRHAREQGVQFVTIASKDDLNRFAQYFPEAKMILRVAIDPKLVDDVLDNETVDIEKAVELLYTASELGIKVVGLSIWLRTLTPTPQLYAYALAQCSKLFETGCALGHVMSVLDIGDRIPHSAHKFAMFSHSLMESICEFFPSSKFEFLKIIAQPGALFAASHFSLVTPVIGKRAVQAALLTSDETDIDSIAFVYQISEGFYGPFGGCIETQLEPVCQSLNTLNDKISTYASFIGPTLCQTDVVRALIRIQQLQIGEWLIWDDMGAYSMANCCTMIGELATAPHIHYFIDHKQWTKIALNSVPSRPRGEEEQFFVAASETDSFDRELHDECAMSTRPIEQLEPIDSSGVDQFYSLAASTICNDSLTLRGELV